MRKAYCSVSFDMDGWWALLDLIKEYPKREDDIIIKKGLPRILKLLNKYKIKSTFFVIGPDVENFRTLYKEVVDAGHEIGNHTYNHNHHIGSQEMSYIREDIKKSHDVIEDCLGITPVGFRTPNYNLTPKLLSIISKVYKYDSSVAPSYYPGLYPFEWLFAPTQPYYPSSENVIKKGSMNILEIPFSINPLFRISISGTYSRLLGLWWLKTGIMMNNRKFTNICFHPRDLVPEIPHNKKLPFYIYYKPDKTVKNFENQIKYLSEKTNTITLCEAYEKFK